MNFVVEWSACAKAKSVLAGLGRTEDATFSPSARRLAVAGFMTNRIAVFEIAIGAAAGRKSVRLTDVVEIEAPTLREPHGLCFLDEHTLVVANRNAEVVIFDAPPPCEAATRHTVSARQTLAGGPRGRIYTPGSVAAFPLDEHRVELLVCNNYANTVTRHTLDRRSDYAATDDEVLLARRLKIPDGICVSPDGAWIAVSNHNTHSVLLYERSRALGPNAEPDGVLRNVLCPHGVRFSADLEHILVADAGAPYVNVYRRNGVSWRGAHDPSCLFPVMEESVFGRGRHNPQEGGPKGIDISGRAGVLVATCESQPLAFFDLDPVLGHREASTNRHRRHLQWLVATAVFNKTGYIARKAA